MNSQVWWFVARSSGIVAWALLSTSVVWGLLLSTKVSTTRIAARRLRPAWLLGLHRHLGGLAVIFTAIHLIGIVADSYVTFSWAAVLVPMASEWKPGAVAFGVVAMYLLIAIEATSLAIRHLPRKVWRWVHRSSFLLYATATWHGITAGTDAGNQWFRAAAWLSLALVIGLTVRLVVVLRAKAAVGSSGFRVGFRVGVGVGAGVGVRAGASCGADRASDTAGASEPGAAVCARSSFRSRPVAGRLGAPLGDRSIAWQRPGHHDADCVERRTPSAGAPSPAPASPSLTSFTHTSFAHTTGTAGLGDGAGTSAVASAPPVPPSAAPVARPAALPPPPPPPPVPVERELVGVSSGPSDEGALEPRPTDS